MSDSTRTAALACSSRFRPHAARLLAIARPARRLAHVGHDATRNMVLRRDRPAERTFDVRRVRREQPTRSTRVTKNVKWIAKLGSQSYGNPTVANGRVYVGTNNDSPRDPRFKGDRSVVYCFDEATGELIWQLNIPKLGTGKVSDWEFLGICSSPSVEGDRVYLVTNRCEVMCLDVNGMAERERRPVPGRGPVHGRPGQAEPMEVEAKTDADIIWSLNMIDECGVFPHNITSSSVLIAGDQAVGLDLERRRLRPRRDARAERAVPDPGRQEHRRAARRGGSGSQPAHLPLQLDVAGLPEDGRRLELCIFGGPDGGCYAFEPEPVEDEDGLRPVSCRGWKLRLQPARVPRQGRQAAQVRDARGPERGPRHPDRLRRLRVRGDRPGPRARRGRRQPGVHRPERQGRCERQGVDYARSTARSRRRRSPTGCSTSADYSGFVYCLDAKTGEEHWIHDTKAPHLGLDAWWRTARSTSATRTAT